jgi:NAD(P)-dependent dehydrogenase (short-subunit alcohol dehydrogenase family)
MNISFENKVALVTGAASGLGLATAKAFAESGASVVLADWNEKDAQSAAKELANKGHKTLAVRCDVSDDAQVGCTITYIQNGSDNSPVVSWLACGRTKLLINSS